MKNFPIFIAGCGRSGTTYLKSLLDAHPDVFIPSESLYIIDYLKSENTLLKPLLKWLYWKEPQLNSWYSGNNFKFATFKEAVEKTHLIESRYEKKTIWGQKTPRFIRYKNFLDKIFPSARWILIYRDPRSVAASMLESKTHFYSLYFACKRWNLDNWFLNKNKGEHNTLSISYEELIKFPNNTLTQIFNFLKINKYSIEFLIKRAKVREYKGSRFKKLSIKKGFQPDTKKINNWKKRLSNQQVGIVEYYTYDRMLELGYVPAMQNPLKPKITEAFSIKDIIIFLNIYVNGQSIYLLLFSEKL